MSPLGSLAAECMDRPCASYDFSRMRESEHDIAPDHSSFIELPLVSTP